MDMVSEGNIISLASLISSCGFMGARSRPLRRIAIQMLDASALYKGHKLNPGEVSSPYRVIHPECCGEPKTLVLNLKSGL